MKNFVTIICFLMLGLTGCVNQRQFPVSSSGSNSYPTPYEPPLSSGDFIQLCNGGKVDKAAGYDKTSNTTSPISVYFQSDPNERFRDAKLTDSPTDWFVNSTNPEKTQLVACITISEKKEARKCPFDDNGKNYQLTMNDAKYNVKVYEAKTGAFVAEKDLDLKANKGCPQFKWFNSQEETEDPDYSQPVINFIKPLVRH